MRFKAAFLAVFLISSPAFADVIKNKNGQALEGAITRETETDITIDVDGMELTLPRTDVVSVQKKPVVKKKRPIPVAAIKEPAPEPKSEPAAMDLSQLEKPLIAFDKRKWKIGFQDYKNNQVLAEFVLDGETVHDWSELVTAQLFIGLRSEPRYFVQYVQEATAKKCPGTQWKVLSEAPYDVLYEWSVQGCEGTPDQAEIARVMLGVDGLHVLHYAVKGVMPEDKRQQWIQGLQASQLVKPQPKNTGSTT